ncbi:hypothetical protein PC116_g31735 [Phytophthora cactorum]|nr:hypothetical protein PC116_g31735 [Phytophthora cactorum]
MWSYTEDGSLDTTDTIVEVDGDGNVINVVENKDETKDKKGDINGKNDDEAEDKSGGKGDTKASTDASPDNESSKRDVISNGEAGEKDNSGTKKKLKGYPVFLFSIEVPAPSETSDA